MKRLRIIPGQWRRGRGLASHGKLCASSAERRLIQVLFSTAGGGGPPAGLFTGD
jgi:hypothetical protein